MTPHATPRHLKSTSGIFRILPTEKIHGQQTAGKTQNRCGTARVSNAQTSIIPMRCCLPTLLLVCTALVAPAPAAETETAKEKPAYRNASVVFTELDQDKSGSLSETEYLAGMSESLGADAAKSRFAELDRDGNGKLSKDEFRAGDPADKERKKRAKRRQGQTSAN